MGSALASGGSILEPAGTGSVRHGGSFWQLLTESHPCTPHHPPYQNLAMQTQYPRLPLRRHQLADLGRGFAAPVSSAQQLAARRGALRSVSSPAQPMDTSEELPPGETTLLSS